jgi:hypothetical protein
LTTYRARMRQCENYLQQKGTYQYFYVIGPQTT